MVIRTIYIKCFTKIKKYTNVPMHCFCMEYVHNTAAITSKYNTGNIYTLHSNWSNLKRNSQP